MSRARLIVTLLIVALLILFTPERLSAQDDDLIFRVTTSEDVQVVVMLEHPSDHYVYEGADDVTTGVSFEALDNGYQINWNDADAGLYTVGVVAIRPTSDPAVVTLETLRDGTLIESHTFNIWPGQDNAHVSVFDFLVDKHYTSIATGQPAGATEPEAPTLAEQIFGNLSQQPQQDQQEEQEQSGEQVIPQPTSVPPIAADPADEQAQDEVHTGPVTIPVTNSTEDDVCYIQIQSMEKLGPMDGLGDDYLGGKLSPGESFTITIEPGAYFFTISLCDAFALHGYQIWDVDLQQGTEIVISDEYRWP